MMRPITPKVGAQGRKRVNGLMQTANYMLRRQDECGGPERIGAQLWRRLALKVYVRV